MKANHIAATPANMKILAILSQKGGAGKTTLALHLATAAEAAGKPCAVIDLDPQASAAGWKDTRPAETPVVVPLPHSRLTAGVQAAREGGASLCIIDTAPHAEGAAMAAARAADLVLIPCRAGILDLRAIGATADFVKIAGKRAFVVLNALPPSRFAHPERCAGGSSRSWHRRGASDFATTRRIRPCPDGRADRSRIRAGWEGGRRNCRFAGLAFC